MKSTTKKMVDVREESLRKLNELSHISYKPTKLRITLQNISN